MKDLHYKIISGIMGIVMLGMVIVILCDMYNSFEINSETELLTVTMPVDTEKELYAVVRLAYIVGFNDGEACGRGKYDDCPKIQRQRFKMLINSINNKNTQNEE